VQLSVGSSTGALLAEVNVLQVPSAFGANGNLLAKLYRRFLDRGEALHAPDTEPGKVAPASLRAATTGTPTTSLARSVDDRRLIVAAAAPVFDASRHTVIGVVQVAQTAERWLLLRDHALTQLMNVTLAATALAVMGSFAFAARLGFRLARLRNATESALTREGRLETQLPDAAARDELGDVARSFGALLSQLDAYTAYLRTLAGKLAHEIRTPLTIVRSSLENLDNEALTDAARAYVGRAREGSERLGGILKAMGAASRVEEAIASADRVIFDVAPVVASAVEAYAQAFPARHFHLELPSDACRIEGAPELLVQLLDKLVENALDFSPEGAEIRVRLTHQAAGVQLDVENSGSRLPAGVDQRLFESLWQSRVEGGEGVHFGLGLYVARLIAEFHHGTIAASNLPGDGGVRIRLWIPLASG
jgi:signal transduction histidine kinase